MEDFDIQDDMVVDANYKEQSNSFVPPKPGTYTFKVEKWQYRTDKDGNKVLRPNAQGQPTYPVVGLTTVSIVEPAEFARKVVVFQDLSSRPFKREDSLVSQTGDLLRAINEDIKANGTGELLTKLAQELNGAHTFRARLDYEAYDGEFVKSEFARLGGKDNLDKDAVNAVYNSAKVKGASKIGISNTAAGQPKLPAHRWVGPSGETVDVKPVLTRFIPSGAEKITLGVDKAFA